MIEKKRVVKDSVKFTLARYFIESGYLVIGCPYTVVLEVLMCEIPVFILDTRQFYNYLPLWSFGISGRLSHLDNSDVVVKRLLSNEEDIEAVNSNEAKKLYLCNNNNDRMLTERVSCELEKIVTLSK